MSSGLIFAPVTLGDIGRIYPYSEQYGEGSCQHSPVSMWSLSEKYEDHFCEKDGCLYIYRAGISEGAYRSYLAPMGGRDPAEAYQEILSDARAYGKKARFFTLTEGQAALLERLFPGRFDIRHERDLDEYIFSVQTFLDFPGKLHARRRTEIRSFWRQFPERAKAYAMTEKDFPEVLAFSERWLKENAETHEVTALERELRCIRRQLRHFSALSLSGTVIRIDGMVQGFCYGAALSSTYYDVLIEKGERGIPGIYRVLRQESTRLNLSGFQFVNFEEDVGVPGLRRLKESYGPAFMIKKYIATER